MTSDEVALFSRIEAALSRIERALASRPAPRPDSNHAHLAARHETLRAEVAVALAQLDALSEAAGGKR